MRQSVWIWNHYATNMFFNEAGRHYCFAKNLIDEGYKPTIFSSSTNHVIDNNIDTKGNKYSTGLVNAIPFVFVKGTKYKGNGIERVVNMVSFYNGLFRASKEYAKKHGGPDVIIASSVHPLTLVAGIKIARKFGVPCICEVRDLWPESIVAYGALRRNSIIAKILYQGEKWIYKKADSVIMTWEGGRQYIEDQGWNNKIDLDKVNYINNGIIIDDFDKNSKESQIVDPELDDKNYKNFIYAGSVRRVNNIGLLLDAANIIKGQDDTIRILIYGDGNEKEALEKRCNEEGTRNVIFKGRVEKKMVPSILKKAYANILHNSSTSLDKYGQSQNKLFEYLAAGRPIIQTYTAGYSILEKYNCGISVPMQTPKTIAEIIIKACSDDDKAKQMGENARVAAYEFDFGTLTHKLIKIIENVKQSFYCW